MSSDQERIVYLPALKTNRGFWGVLPSHSSACLGKYKQESCAGERAECVWLDCIRDKEPDAHPSELLYENEEHIQYPEPAAHDRHPATLPPRRPSLSSPAPSPSACQPQG
jgi:hypothetical protein